jgi:hypothetical protein
MRRWSLVLAALLAACINESSPNGGGGGGPLPVPTGLRYEVTPGGPGIVPVATLLEWDLVDDPVVVVWNVYSRTTTSDGWGLRGTTTSPSFHDYGVPELEYYVTSVDVDGFESSPSGSVRIDERLTLPNVTSLRTTSLDGAIALVWSDNPFEADPAGFRNYRVYSAAYDLDANECADAWSLEGTTVAPEFIAGVLANGVPRCFGVSAATIEGFESLWSPIVDDTPRPESRNIAVSASQVTPGASGFRFWRDQNSDNVAQRGELGLVVAGNATEADFSIERDAANAMFLTAQRAGVTIATYGGGPVADLTSIDIAPVTGYSRVPVELQPGHGYVAQISGALDGFVRFGAVRVTHVGRDFIILDWSYQTDPGNPQLVRR